MIEDKGLPILHVVSGSLADRAGVIKGDIILTVNDIECNDFEDYLRAKDKGSPLRMTVQRGGQLLDLELRERNQSEKSYWA